MTEQADDHAERPPRPAAALAAREVLEAAVEQAKAEGREVARRLQQRASG